MRFSVDHFLFRNGNEFNLDKFKPLILTGEIIFLTYNLCDVLFVVTKTWFRNYNYYLESHLLMPACKVISERS